MPTANKYHGYVQNTVTVPSWVLLISIVLFTLSDAKHQANIQCTFAITQCEQILTDLWGNVDIHIVLPQLPGSLVELQAELVVSLHLILVQLHDCKICRCPLQL